MKFIRDFLDKIEPHFLPGGKLEKHYPGFEAADTFLYTPGETAEGGTHVRDSIDLKRLMITVVIALIPCIFMAMYNTGYQANKIIAAASNPMKYDGRIDMNGDGYVNDADRDGVVTREELPEAKEGDYTPKTGNKPSMRSLFVDLDINGDGQVDQAESVQAIENETLVPAIAHADWTPDWTLNSIRYKMMDSIGVSYSKAGSFGGNFLPSNWGTLLACLIHGALYFLPIYIVTMVIGGNCEMIFSVIRKHEINEGFLVTGMLYPLTLPASIPLWQVAVGIIFGIVIGKEIFGGTGRNFLNPALTARAFLYFAYPVQIVGSTPWVPVDGYSGATVLGAVADANVTASAGGSIKEAAREQVTNTMTNLPVKFEGATVLDDIYTPASSFMNFFWGDMQGSMGETSAFCCLLGAAILIATGIGSWRIMAGCTVGLLAVGAVIWSVGGEEAVFNIAPHWHLVIGSFAFGAVFMATDPVSASMTNTGRWIYGFLIGAITIMVRVINPAFPEGVMLAILFGNVCAPLIDYWVVQQNVKRRMARNDA